MSEDELPDRCCGCVGDYCCKHGEAPCPTEEEPVAETPTTITVDIAAGLTVIRPGDTVLIGTQRSLSKAEADRLATELGDRMPGVKVLVLEGVTAISSYRP